MALPLRHIQYRVVAICIFALLVLAGAVQLTVGWSATVPSKTGELISMNDETVNAIVNEGATVTLGEEADSKVLQAEFPGGNGYPAFTIRALQGAWDLSAFAGVQIEVKNSGQTGATIALRVDNAGDWKKNPWNTEQAQLGAGATKTIKVTFGKSYGGTGYALDPAKVVALKIFAVNPQQTTVVKITKINAFGTAPAAAATAPAATGTPSKVKLFTADEAMVSSIRNEGAAVSLADTDNGKALKADFQVDNYPGFVIPATSGTWDLSAFTGVQMGVTNKSEIAISVALRVDNAGNWQNSPWNTESIRLAPGESKTVKVTFGKSYGGQTGYALDASKVVGVKVFLDRPKQPVTLYVTSLEPFGTATTTATPATASASTANAAPAGGVVFAPTERTDVSTIKTSQATVSLATENGAAVKMEYSQLAGYPTIDFPAPTGGWNLSAYSGIQAEITNAGQAPVVVCLRADNGGDWKKNPWNAEQTRIPAGETKTITVTFGKSYGGTGYALDPSQIVSVKVFAVQPSQPGTLLVKSIKGVGTRQASTTTATPATAGTVNTTAPAISGELLSLSDTTDLATVKTAQTEVSITKSNGAAALQVNFVPGENLYPNVQFPIPTGGWNLSAFGAVQVQVTNPGTTDVTAYMRVDNPGSWKESPWNTNTVRIPAGQTKTLRVTFGESDGAPGFPLNPERVVGIQVFLIRPKQATTLILQDLKASGSPKDRATGLTSPDDRNKTVTLPAWSGQRPPVEGDWVQTLNENFDGTAINEKIWSDKTWWNGLLNGQTQRYSKNNLVLDNGILKIKCENRPGPQYDDPTLPTRTYTTGHLVTYGKWTQRYGYFEARIKVPTARGLWPAFWLMPDRGPTAGTEGWKRENTKDGGMEMDILEHLTEWGGGRYNVAVHWDGYDKDHKTWGTANVYYSATPDNWHTWGLLWEPGKVSWYCDGRKTAEFANERVGSVPAYIILNVQMGGWATKDVDETKLPDYMQVDYVRVWQLKNRIPQ